MIASTTQASPRLKARLAGVFYLITVLTGLFAEVYVRGSLIVSGDAGATARNILASQTLYRFGFVADLVGAGAYAVVTLLLYQLLRPIDRSISLLAALSSAIGIAIGGAGVLGHIAPLFILNGSPYLAAFSATQLQALAFLSLKMHAQAYLIALVFFGWYEVLLGYLIVRSTFLPRALGVLVGIAGLAFLINSFALFLSPTIGAALNAYMLGIDGIGEIALTFWLLIFGVNVQRWYERSERATVTAS
ncbi:MAG: DUF4386 domain-containing protein [Candidatus Eremiobacteraeota bacterium]|nr:DUF4386 domain-containing protein [Candidatus Eremiobacteraeota bacterium]MBV9055636.1 DUF4386 domain-containing protein [Candidatus Eremiobacteraeota bacterium]MBV9700238.1 DUF4386 domain-containing protein [Candidatus Eremiobacteraeota bacterium]